MAKLDINGYNATFRTFVEFAEKTQRDGYDSACAKATLAGKRITVSALSLHETSRVLRKTGEKTSNDSTRAIFRNAVTEMFGGGRRLLLGEPSANTPYPLARTFAPPPHCRRNMHLHSTTTPQPRAHNPTNPNSPSFVSNPRTISTQPSHIRDSTT